MLRETCVLLALAALAFAVDEPRRLTIVAPKEFCGALEEFVEFKRARLETTLVAIEDVGAEGTDEPERLKRFLHDAWRHRGLRYVLLVGDADVLPVRYMVLDRCTEPAFDYAFYPSDLYYADLAREDGTFEDWNGAREGFHAAYFGEVRGEKNKKDPINFDRIDYRPEIAVGRWPVSTPEEVRIVVAKTMAYERGVEGGISPGLRRAGLFVVDGWVDARDLFGGLAEKLGTWSVERRFYGDDPGPSEAEAVKLLNAGTSLLCHAGHGSDDAWGGCLSVASLARVKNADRLPVLISAGCSTARFATLPPYEAYVDVEGVEHKGTNAGEAFTAPPPPPAPFQRGAHNPTGLGEQLLRRGPDGAVAYIGCNTGSQPCGLTLVEGFVTAIGESKSPRIGDCWARAVAFYYERERLAKLVPTEDWYPPSIFFQGMKFMLYGDPSAPIPAAR
ncbi:MAG: C25 family cysteine peptidase [Planctomycetota bacterium]